jgi:hypothetical protein
MATTSEVDSQLGGKIVPLATLWRSMLLGVTKTVLVVVLVAIGGFLAGAQIIPHHIVVERNQVITASPDKVFAVAAHLRRFGEWSPWSDLDPRTVLTFEGPDSGPGQIVHWVSAVPDVGQGSLSILELKSDEWIAGKVSLSDGEVASMSMTFVPVANGTSVTWRYEKDVSGVLGPWRGIGYDRWVGAPFVRGLGLLKTIVEKDGPLAG